MKYYILFICFFTSFLSAFGQNKYEIQFSFEGRVRDLIVSVPTKPAPAEGYPVVVMFHGTNGDANVFYNAKGWKELGQEENFITVFPSSLRWCYVDDGITKQISRFVCGTLLDSICPADTSNLVNDVDFIRRTISLLKDTVQLNMNKIFVSGFSNGSSMMHKCAMDGGDLFSAAAGSSSPLHELDSITPQKRMPIWYMFGTKDDRYFSPNFPTELPFGEDSILGYHRRPILRALACQGLTENYTKYETTMSKTYIWRECRPGETCAPYIMTLNKDQQHIYPNGNNFPIDAPKLFWEFFNNPPSTTMSSSSEETYFERGIKIFPNPAFENITIETGLPLDKEWNFYIYDVNGKLMYTGFGLKGPDSVVNICSLPQGMYTVKIESTLHTVCKKFIKM